MNLHEKINYVEFPCRDLSAAKQFFAAVFGWTFTDFGQKYVAFDNAGLQGGFYHSPLISRTNNGSALIVFYSTNLRDTENKIVQHGGTIIQPRFSFPGGQRFHFTAPGDNEFAVWSDQ